jgi:hypothetical protein
MGIVLSFDLLNNFINFIDYLLIILFFMIYHFPLIFPFPLSTFHLILFLGNNLLKVPSIMSLSLFSLFISLSKYSLSQLPFNLIKSFDCILELLELCISLSSS